MKKNFAIACLMSLILGIAAPSSAAEKEYTGKPVQIIWSNYYAENNDTVKKVIRPYMDHIIEYTKGKIQFKEFWGGTLHGFFEGHDAVKNGITGISQTYIVNRASSYNLINVGEMPFAFKNQLVAALVMEQLYPKYFKKEFEKLGIYLASYPAIGMSTGIITKRPVRNVDDLKGLKIVTGGGLISETFKALGAVPVTVPATELFSAFQRGVVDAVASAPGQVIPRQLEEIGKYFTQLDANMMGIAYGMNRRTFDTLPSPLKPQLYTALRQANYIMSYNYLMLDKDAEAELKAAGVEYIRFSPEEAAKMKAAVAPLWDSFIEKNEKKGLPARELVNELRALADKYGAMSNEELKKMVWETPVKGIIKGF